MGKAEKSKESWGESRKAIKRNWHVPIVFVEWICWRISPFLGQLDFLKVLEYCSRLAVLIAIFFYFGESDGRRKAKHYQAWQVINSAQGKPGSGGRIDAIQDLNQDRVSLRNVDLSNSHLPEINLKNGWLPGANLSGTNLFRANLVEAQLERADLSGASLLRANLSGAFMNSTNLVGAQLEHADLSGAYMYRANLTNSSLYGTDFSGADMAYVILEGASLREASVRKADLYRANLSNMYIFETDFAKTSIDEVDLRMTHLEDIKNWREIKSIRLANIHGIKDAPEGFVEWALEQGAVRIEDSSEWKKLCEKQEARRL